MPQHKQQKNQIVVIVKERKDGTKYLSRRRKQQPKPELKPGWTIVPQKTLRNLMLLVEKVDSPNFHVKDVEKILGLKESAAESYYRAFFCIHSLKQGQKQKRFIQSKTLRKLVALFEKSNGGTLTWQQIRKALNCSRPTAKRFETVMLRLNSKIRSSRSQIFDAKNCPK
jgi:hypothetical protein